jgi:hypothetical protein
VLERPRPLKYTTVRLSIDKQRLDQYHPQMKKGDYFLDGFPHATVIERKGSIDEITTNVFNSHRRDLFIEELEYLKARSAHPVLLCEGSPRTILTQGHSKTPAGVALDGLLDLLHRYGITLFLLASESRPARAAMGEFAARLLIRGALQYG